MEGKQIDVTVDVSSKINVWKHGGHCLGQQRYQRWHFIYEKQTKWLEWLWTIFKFTAFDLKGSLSNKDPFVQS